MFFVLFVVLFFLLLQAHSSDNDQYVAVYVSDGITWSEAESYCENNYGANLASIHSEDDNDAAFSLIPVGNNAWIGFNDINQEGSWVWTDGTAYDYEAWHNIAPNFSEDGIFENCVIFYYDGNRGKWMDISCGVSTGVNYFICNKENAAATNYTSNDYYQAVQLSNPISWSNAESYCNREFGTSLATINNENENTLARSLTLNWDYPYAWIGLNDDDIEGDWHWVEYGLGGANYFNWYGNNEPNGGISENCVSFAPYSDKWVDASCESLLFINHFICNKVNHETPTTPDPTTQPTQQPTITSINSVTGDNTILSTMSTEIQLIYSIEYNASGVTWYEAESYCLNTYLSHLASIHSDSENSFAFSLIPISYSYFREDAWIGLNDIDEEGNWTWTDGTPYDYESFYSVNGYRNSEPDGGRTENCISFFEKRYSYYFGTWKDSNCNVKKNYFLCGQPNSRRLMLHDQEKQGKTQEKEEYDVLLIVLIIVGCMVLISICIFGKKRKNININSNKEKNIKGNYYVEII